jgi:site-specific DNA recombinase
MRGRRARPLSPAARVAVGYVRVSTDEQAVDGVSLDAQTARIIAHAEAVGRPLESVVRDAGMSASRIDSRPNLEAILADVRAGKVSAVVVLKLDRLTRSVRDLIGLVELFAKHDCALISASESIDTGNAAGRMIVNMFGVVAQWEREAIAERTADALTHKRRQRNVYGRTPFGYRREGDGLIEEPRQQAALGEIIAAWDNGRGASLRTIAAQLEAQGIATSRGGLRWHASTVRSVLNSRMTSEREGAA